MFEPRVLNRLFQMSRSVRHSLPVSCSLGDCEGTVGDHSASGFHVLRNLHQHPGVSGAPLS